MTLDLLFQNSKIYFRAQSTKITTGQIALHEHVKIKAVHLSTPLDQCVVTKDFGFSFHSYSPVYTCARVVIPFMEELDRCSPRSHPYTLSLTIPFCLSVLL